MTCEDCYFHEVCHSRIVYSYDMDEAGNVTQDVEKSCKHFKAKSCIIELPAELGSTVWCDVFLNGFIQPCILIGANIHHKEDRYRQSYILVRFPSGGSGKIRLKDIGERLFFTKEDAESAVAKRNSKVDTK